MKFRLDPILTSIADQAAADTAQATWCLVWGTDVAALATFCAVGAAFLVPVWDRYLRTKKHKQEQRKRSEAASREIQKSIGLMGSAKELFESGIDLNLPEVWSLLNQLNVARRLMEYWLKSDLGNENDPVHLIKTIQSLYETRDACQDVADEKVGLGPADAGRQEKAAIIARAVERCGPEPKALVASVIS